MKKKSVFLVLVFVLFLIGIVTSQEYAPNEVIVKYRDDVVGWGNKVIVDGEIVKYNEVEKPVGESRIVEDEEIYILKFKEGVDVLEVAKDYGEINEVEYAEPNFLMKSDFVPSDNRYDELYWPEMINIEKAWNISFGSKEVVIAIIDTGVDWHHEDLLGNIINRSDGCNASIDFDSNGYNGDCRGYDFTDINVTNYLEFGYTLVEGEDYNLTDNDPDDIDGHGTHVAGIAAGVGNNSVGILGSCFNCSIMPVRSGFSIISPGQSFARGSLETDDVARAIYYAAENNATIISMSFGGGDHPLIRDAISYAYEKGSILVASSGNSGSESTQYPCAYEEVICVGAIDQNGNAASYSTYGSWVNLAVPGSFILSTVPNNDYQSLSGTSMSTPMVAGVIGLIKSVFREKNVSEILFALETKGEKVNFSGINISGVNTYETILYLDNINPGVNLISPEEEYLTFEVNNTFVCNGSDWQLDSATLFIWDSDNEIFYNETRNISGLNNESTFEVNLSSGDYEWNCLVEDSKGNGGYAANNFSLSVLGSWIKLDSPEDNYYTNSRENYFSCSAQVDAGKTISNMSFSIWNSSEIIYFEEVNLSGDFNSSTFSYNFSNEGEYFWACEFYDNENESISGNNFSIVYDITSPNVFLESPSKGKAYDLVDNNIKFNFNVSEESNCSLVVNELVVSENESFVLNGSFVQEFESGSYSWSVSCSDRAGNFGTSENRSFIVNEAPASDPPQTSSGGGGGSRRRIPEVNVSLINESLSLDNETEFNIEDNFKVDTRNQSGITGLVVDDSNFGLAKFKDYRDEVNIFVVLILGVLIFLFYRDFKYEREINSNIKESGEE